MFWRKKPAQKPAQPFDMKSFLENNRPFPAGSSKRKTHDVYEFSPVPYLQPAFMNIEPDAMTELTGGEEETREEDILTPLFPPGLRRFSDTPRLDRRAGGTMDLTPKLANLLGKLVNVKSHAYSYHRTERGRVRGVDGTALFLELGPNAFCWINGWSEIEILEEVT